MYKEIPRITFSVVKSLESPLTRRNSCEIIKIKNEIGKVFSFQANMEGTSNSKTIGCGLWIDKENSPRTTYEAKIIDGVFRYFVSFNYVFINYIPKEISVRAFQYGGSTASIFDSHFQVQ